MPASSLQSFFLGGFESSTMRRRDGRRNDLVAATRHDVLAVEDYARLAELGITTVREGIAWHRLERRPGEFDASSVIDRVRAAEAGGVQVIWDLCHFGWPDDVDPLNDAFPQRLAAMGSWFAQLLRGETSSIPWYVPLNEPSFVAWAGGDVEYLNPFRRGQGDRLKRNLVRASIEAASAVRAVDPRARICHVDPIIHVEPRTDSPDSRSAAARYSEAQFEAWDMLAGRQHDELGGSEAELDLLGVNFYDRNQWVDAGPTLDRRDPRFRPLRTMLADVYARYRRPIIVAETGAEDIARAPWLRYVCDEVAAARDIGVAVEGICLYPVVDHPGWDDDRHVPVGLWGYPDAHGQRPAYEPLVTEVRDQSQRFVDDERFPPLHRRSSSSKAGRSAILLVSESRAPSGMGHQMLTLAAGLAADHRVIVAGPDAADGRWLLDTARRQDIEVWALVDAHPLAQAAHLSRLLAEDDVDLVNVHAGIGWEGHAAVAAARAAGVRTVIRTEHLPYLLTKSSDEAVYHRALDLLDGIIAVSEGVASSHIVAGVPAELLHVVRNGIEDPAVPAEPSAVRRGLGIRPDVPFVVTVGRLTEQKGYEVLLPAIVATMRQCPEARFLIVGSGPLSAELDRAIEASGHAGSIQRLPYWHDVPALLAAADVLVLASRFEGLPLVTIEAMATGRPVVGTRVCGMTEAIVDRVTGRLVEPGDAGALAAGILDVLAEPRRAAAYGAAGRRRYERLFTARRMVEDTLGVYRALLGRPPIPVIEPTLATVAALGRSLTSIR